MIALTIRCSEKEIPYDLLLLADPSRERIDAYLPHAELYAAHARSQLVGCYVLYRLGDGCMEIKNIAVDEGFQGQGIGTQLLADAIRRAAHSGAKQLVIGTGNSSLGQLYLYQKMGFRITGIKPNFFVDLYPEPIVENGLPCIDMLVLTKNP